MYSGGREGFGLVFSATATSSVMVVRWAITGESLERKWEPHLMI